MDFRKLKISVQDRKRVGDTIVNASVVQFSPNSCEDEQYFWSQVHHNFESSWMTEEYRDSQNLHSYELNRIQDIIIEYDGPEVYYLEELPFRNSLLEFLRRNDGGNND